MSLAYSHLQAPLINLTKKVGSTKRVNGVAI